jgi:hypothetical protein
MYGKPQSVLKVQRDHNHIHLYPVEGNGPWFGDLPLFVENALSKGKRRIRMPMEHPAYGSECWIFTRKDHERYYAWHSFW